MDKHKELANIFKALSDANRIKLLEALSENDQLCVGMLTRKLDISQPAVSQHLKVLKSVHLVHDERVGYHVHYRINRDILKQHQSAYLKMMHLEENPTPCLECPEDLKQ